jgi:hypothetical protein
MTGDGSRENRSRATLARGNLAGMTAPTRTKWRAYAYDRFERARRGVPVGELVDRVIDHHRIGPDLREARLFAEWSQLVGERIGQRTRPQSIWDRVLVVEVATSSWLHELRLIRPKLVSDLLDQLGMPRPFDDIRFVLAKEDRRSGRSDPAPRRPARPARRAPAAPRTTAPASGGARDQILRETERIADPELRALIAKVRIGNDR